MSSPPLSIRLFEDSDWHKVWSLLEPIFRAGETYAYSPLITAAEAKVVWVQVPQETYVASLADSIVGTYYLKPNQPELGAHVCNCGYAVSPEARGRGVASAMCVHSQVRAAEIGFKAMQYNLVVITNAGAIRLWERHGFEKLAQLPAAFRSQTQGYVDALVMYKLLDPGLRKALASQKVPSENAVRSSKQAAIDHYKVFFSGHESSLLSWQRGPIQTVLPEFQVLRFSPGERIGLWIYCSVGASHLKSTESGLLEFVIAAPFESPSLVETLAMVAHYHANHSLGFGHTFPIGKPWLEGSACTNWLVSVPYPFGEELELMPLVEGHAHVAWLLPITEAERDFKIQHGLEALEQQFEDAELEFWDVDRPSVI